MNDRTASDPKSQIVEVWKLVSVMYEDQETMTQTPVLGDNPKGSRSRHRTVAGLRSRHRQRARCRRPTQERAQAFVRMIAYSGRYRIEGNTITTKVEVAWNKSWVGGEQVRHIRFEDDKLFIESPPMPHPNMNDRVVRVIVVWQRDERL